MARKDVFQITEKPVPLSAWQDGETDAVKGLEKAMSDRLFELGTLQLKLRELEKEHGKSTEGLLLDILECLDSFKGVFRIAERFKEEFDPQMRRLVESFLLVSKQLENVLTKQRVDKINDSAAMFDPELHQISETVAHQDMPDGHILGVDFDGYTWNGRVLRKPKVRVVRNYATDFDAHAVEHRAERSDS